MVTTDIGDPALPPGVSVVTLVPTWILSIETNFPTMTEAVTATSKDVFPETGDLLLTSKASTTALDAATNSVGTSIAAATLSNLSVVGLAKSTNSAEFSATTAEATTFAPATITTQTVTRSFTLQKPTSTEKPKNKPGIKVGPIDLPAFMSLVFFGPFFLPFLIWIAYRKTTRRWILSRRPSKEAQTEINEVVVTRDVERQAQGFFRPHTLDRTGKGKNAGIGVAV